MVYRGNATWQGGNRMMELYAALHESLFGTKRTSQRHQSMSGLGGKADIAQTLGNVRW
jgi:hypothetical protein